MRAVYSRGERCAHVLAQPSVHEGREAGLSVALEAQQVDNFEQRRRHEADAQLKYPVAETHR